jgi:hypothetical protein
VCDREREKSMAKMKSRNKITLFRSTFVVYSVLLQKKKLLNNIMTGLVKSCHLFVSRKSVGRKEESGK